MGSHRVLVVEDDDEHAEDLQELLGAMHFECDRASNAEDALQLVKGLPFCLIMLDLEIRKNAGSIKGHLANGIALLNSLRDVLPGRRGAAVETPVVVISAHA